MAAGIKASLGKLAELVQGADRLRGDEPFEVLGWRFEALPSLIDELTDRRRVAELVVGAPAPDGQTGAGGFLRVFVERRVAYAAGRDPSKAVEMATEDVASLVAALRRPSRWAGQTTGIFGLQAHRRAVAVDPIHPDGRGRPVGVVVGLPFDLIYREIP